jgi:hypothetical protein
MLQFAELPFITELFRHPWFKDRVRLAKAYRSLPRPYSALEPSHPLVGVTLPIDRSASRRQGIIFARFETRLIKLLT